MIIQNGKIKRTYSVNINIIGARRGNEKRYRRTQGAEEQEAKMSSHVRHESIKNKTNMKAGSNILIFYPRVIFPLSTTYRFQ